MAPAREVGGTDEHLARLQRAAFGRDATDDDRAALADYVGARSEPVPAPTARRRRFTWLTATALLLGAAAGAGAMAWAGGVFRGDAFDRFTTAVSEPRLVAEATARLATLSVEPGLVYIGGEAVVGTLAAGPVPLHSSHGVDLLAILATPVEGEQQVCIVEVGADVGVGSVCVPRSQFEEQGIAHRFARDDEHNPVLEIVGRADDSVTIREADLSRIP